MSQRGTYTTQDLGHLGLVAGMGHELKIADMIDQLLPPTEKQISHGTAVCAMILNGLGFVNYRLYLAEIPHVEKMSGLFRALCGPWPEEPETVTVLFLLFFLFFFFFF